MQTLSATKAFVLASFASVDLCHLQSPPLAWLQLSFDVDVKQVDISNPSSHPVLLLYFFSLITVHYDLFFWFGNVLR